MTAKPLLASLILLSHVLVSDAYAWTRAGHMVTGAIAYDELAAQDRKVIEQIMALMAKHPDRAPFEVAVGRTTGEEANRRVFMEMARWADDIRGGFHDHPSWHYSSRPIVDKAAPPPRRPADRPQGSATEAFALNASVAADAGAPAAERAVALCWIFHLAGDIHQPLHSASWFSQRLPNGDRGGGLQFVRDPQSNEPMPLHLYWDDSVSRDNEPQGALQRARQLQQTFPRAQFRELGRPTSAGDFSVWAQESYELATTLAFGPELVASDSAASARELPKSYVDKTARVAEARLTLSAYRLADVLRSILAQP